MFTFERKIMPLKPCPSFKISLGNPYLKILDLSKLFAQDANMIFFVIPPQSSLKYGSENRPCTRVKKKPI